MTIGRAHDRRIELIENAIEPLRQRLDDATYRRLLTALTSGAAPPAGGGFSHDECFGV